MTGEIKLPIPHSGQRAVLLAPHRIKWVSAGRRWRKTTMALHPTVLTAMGGGRVIWGAPTFDQARIGWGEARKATGIVAQFNLSRMEANMPGGGQIVFRSLDDPDNARGYTADGVVLDEAAMIHERAWYEVIRPMISDTGGWVLGLSTPNGRNWFWRECMAAADRDDTGFWQAPTFGVEITESGLQRKAHPLENPAFDFTEAQAMYQGMPENTFRQEFLAAFLEDSGAVFRNIQQCIIPADAEPPRWIQHRRYVGGIDWAQLSDYTAFFVIDTTTKRVVDYDRFNQIDWATQRARLRTMDSKWRGVKWLAELNSIGSPNVEALQADGLDVTGFTTTSQTKAELVQALALALEQSEIGIPDWPVMLGELEAFEAERLPSGRWRYSAPGGMHDDTVIALALAWWGVVGGVGNEMIMDTTPYTDWRG